MAVVPTVTGSIDSADLGRVLAHEHIFVVGRSTGRTTSPTGTRTPRSSTP